MKTPTEYPEPEPRPFRSTMPDFAGFLTTEEVLAYLRITPRTMYRMIRNGEIPAVRIGRQWRFRRPDLDVWVRRNRPDAAVLLAG